MSIDDLFVEAERQLNICNSCRYCAGHCPMWPALERRTELDRADITHLANLCHDCHDCFTACMYTAPHEFDLNPPQIFAAVREDTYRRYVWPSRAPAALRGRRGVAAAFAVAVVLVAVLGALTGDPSAGRGSPYGLIPHVVLLMPYPLLSVPVLTGTVGGVAASIGCAGLLVLKHRSNRLETTDTMRRADHGLLWSLLVLMVTGLGVLVTRTTAVFPVVLAVHLAAVLTAFAVTPYTKFFHWVYRVLSIQHDNLESARRAEHAA